MGFVVAFNCPSAQTVTPFQPLAAGEGSGQGEYAEGEAMREGKRGPGGGCVGLYLLSIPGI